jgi:response regulator NasT
MARILVIDESQHRAVEICTGLIKAGHQVAAVIPSALELIDRIEEIKPDIILIETESPSRDTLEHLAVMNRLKCCTSCGSCVPEIKRMLAVTQPA